MPLENICIGTSLCNRHNDMLFWHNELLFLVSWDQLYGASGEKNHFACSSKCKHKLWDRHVNESLILYCIFKGVYMYFTSPTGIIYAIPSQELTVCFFQQQFAFLTFGGIKWSPCLLLESKPSFIFDCYYQY